MAAHSWVVGGAAHPGEVGNVVRAMNHVVSLHTESRVRLLPSSYETSLAGRAGNIDAICRSSFLTGGRPILKFSGFERSCLHSTGSRGLAGHAAGSVATSSATAEYVLETGSTAAIVPEPRERLFFIDEDDKEDDFEDEEELEADDDILSISKLGVMDELVLALKNRGIDRLFPIQRAVLVPAMEGRDLIARAKTGTGKTLAFGIPVIENILREDLESPPRRGRKPRCLVLAPTRELAKQVEREFCESAPSLSTVCVYGGVSISAQERTLRQGVDVAVGTPGRLQDLIERGAISLDAVRYVVLDEADQMLAVGFEEDVENILSRCPSERQTLLFSATMPSWVKKLSKKYLSDPLLVDLVGDSDEKLADTIKLFAVRTPTNAKRSILSDLITIYGRGGKTIIFTQTKKEADEVAVTLSRKIVCQSLHGDIAQLQREKTLGMFRDGRFGALVATDVAARGLDIPNVELVIHYEMPHDPETFVHRSGRTGRAGKGGVVILMHTESQGRTVRILERETGAVFQRIMPPAKEEVLDASAEQAVEVLVQVPDELREVFLPTAERLMAETGGAQALAAALAHMSGYTKLPSSRSLITHEEGWVTLRMVRTARSRSGPLASARSVMGALGEIMRTAADNVGKIRMLSERNVEGAVFDLPEDLAKELMTRAAAANTGDVVDIPKQLPMLVDDNFSGGGMGRGGRGGMGGRGGGGDRDRRGPGGFRGGSSSSRGSGRGGGRYDMDGGGWQGASRRSSSSSSSWGESDGYYGSRSGSRERGGAGGPFSGVCYLCKKPGHRASECPSGSGR